MTLEHRLKIPDEVAMLVRGLHPDLKQKVRAGLDQILLDPTSGQAQQITIKTDIVPEQNRLRNKIFLLFSFANCLA
jgi:hypothetical protein